MLLSRNKKVFSKLSSLAVLESSLERCVSAPAHTHTAPGSSQTKSGGLQISFKARWPHHSSSFHGTNTASNKTTCCAHLSWVTGELPPDAQAETTVARETRRGHLRSPRSPTHLGPPRKRCHNSPAKQLTRFQPSH